MSDKSWLKNLIDEDIYVFGIDDKSPNSTKVKEEAQESPSVETKLKKVQKEAAVILSKEDLDKHSALLGSILSTLGHSLESVDVISKANSGYKWVIDFENESTDRYTLLNTDYHLIYSASLSELDKDRNLKLALWSAIKELKNLQATR